MSLSKFQTEKCLKLIDKLMKWKICEQFIEMVDPVRDQAPNYLKVVTTPMSLQEVKNRLLGKRYRDVSEFTRDVNLIWENAKNYNGVGHIYTNCAMEASIWFKKKTKHFPETIEEEWMAKMQKATREFYDAIMHPPADLVPEKKEETLSDLNQEPVADDNNLMEPVFDSE